MKHITLKEAFNKKSVTALKDIASACRVRSYTKMKKDELVDACSEVVQRKGFFEEHAFILPTASWEFFMKVAESASGVKGNAERVKYALSERLGFLHVEKCENGYWFVVPVEIKEVYDKLIKDGFSEIKKFSDLIHEYAQAAVNLYGIIPQEELVEIFNSQNKEKTTIDVNFQVFMKHIGLNADYCLWEEYIVHEDLEEDDFEDVKALVRDTEGKPRYIPDKSEFLKYADWTYYENTEEMIKLSQFLIKKCGVSNADIAELMFDLHFEFAEEISVSNYFDVLERYNVVIEEKHLNELIALMMDCCNNTRLWANKGYTPNELVGLHRMPQQKTKKTGRNEPCPCGSGKKYKKCCGI